MLFNRLVRNLKIHYFIFWLLPIVVVAGYEFDIFPVGVYADDPKIQYILETTGILVAIICVPLALKLFSIAHKKRIDRVNLVSAMHKYLLWSGIRLGILEVAVLTNVVVYYMTLSNVGSFCGLIALTTSLFCLPGEKRLREELNITNEE